MNKPHQQCAGGSRLSVRWLCKAAGMFLTIILLAACAPLDREIQATQTLPTRQPAQLRPSATFAPSPTATPTRTPTAARSATFTAVPTNTSTPTLLPGMVQVRAGRVVVPILLYHHIGDQADTRYTVSVRRFREQMKLLHDEGYQTVGVSQLSDVIRQGGALPEKPIVLTFDDGYQDVYTNAFPVLQEFGFTGVTYIITSTLEKSRSYGYMQERELKELLAAGWEVGSHSVTHTDLKKTKLGPGNEVRQSKEVLEVLLGVPVRSFCYPYGIANQSIKELVQAAGYDSAVGLDILLTHTTERLYYLSRREVTGSMAISAFRNLLEPFQDELAVNESHTRTPAAP